MTQIEEDDTKHPENDLYVDFDVIFGITRR